MSLLDQRLDAFQKAEIKPKDAAESCDLALLCAWPSRRLFGEAVRLYEQAFAVEPARAADLHFGYRWYAATCAARAAAGQGNDAHTPAEKAYCRARALEWLQADLALRRKQIKDGTPEHSKDAVTKLRFWQTAPDLAGVRDESALEAMTERERAQWNELWRSVAELVQKSAGRP